MSTTQRTGKPTPEPATDMFRLVYASSKKPTTRHLDKRCWSTVEYRKATAEELGQLPVCKHCKRRAILDGAKAAEESQAKKTAPGTKPKRQPISRHEGAATQAEPQKVAA